MENSDTKMHPNVTDYDHEMHALLLSKSRVKSSIGTSTLMAGFALVRKYT